MARTQFYDGKIGTTHVELFYETSDGRRIPHRRMSDQDAYDMWHLALYVKEVLATRRLLRLPAFALHDIPRLEKNLLLYLVLAAEQRFRSVFELGSSLFEVIDALEAVAGYFRRSGSPLASVDPRSLRYVGVEMSPLLAEASLALHEGYAIEVHRDVTACEGSFDVLYDRAVTSDVFETAAEAAAFLNRFDVALVNLFVSKGSSFVTTRIGKAFTYFSLDELVGSLRQPLFHLFGQRAPLGPGEPEPNHPHPVVEGFFLMGAETFVERFMALGRADASVAQYFAAKGIAPRLATDLFLATR